ncbi:unnamed protein product, partial [Adineta ricciae]
MMKTHDKKLAELATTNYDQFELRNTSFTDEYFNDKRQLLGKGCNTEEKIQTTVCTCGHSNQLRSRNHRGIDVIPNDRILNQMNAINDIIANLDPIIGYAEEPLVSLTEACAPLVTIIDNLSIYVQQALNETGKSPADRLTVDESAAIRLYTFEWEDGHCSLYAALNRTLKTDARHNLRPYFKYLKLFLTALAKLSCVPPLVLWRGVTKDLSVQFPPGTSVIWWSFTSCTTSLPVLQNNMYLGDDGKRTLFSVEAINGRDIRAHSHFVNEDEVLLLPGTQMIVQSQFSPAPDLHIIHLKQIVPEEILLEPPFPGACLYPKTRYSWYRKKRFVVPICSLTILLITAIILGSVLGTRSSKSTCNRPFEASKKYSVGSNPSYVALGHFRNDREIDIAVTNREVNSVTVLFGDGHGTFKYPWLYDVGRGPLSVLSYDFNSDKNMDLVITNQYSNTIGIMLGNGDGYFRPMQNYDVGQHPTYTIAADFNNDTTLDLAVVNSGDNNVNVLLGNADGTFRRSSNYTVGLSPTSIVSADFNGDAYFDLAVTNSNDDSISVLLGNGNGSFRDQLKYSVSSGPYSIVAADFDNDHRIDLAVANQGDDTVSVLLGIGDGAFHSPRNYSVGRMPQSIIAVDIDNDRKVDLAVVSYADATLSILRGNGDGTFETRKAYTVGKFPYCVIAADFNKDKIMDFAAALYTDKMITILPGLGNGTFANRLNYTVGRYPASLTSADFNNDNQLDLAVVNYRDD